MEGARRPLMRAAIDAFWQSEFAKTKLNTIIKKSPRIAAVDRMLSNDPRALSLTVKTGFPLPFPLPFPFPV
jgi:hypothetical protein